MSDFYGNLIDQTLQKLKDYPDASFWREYEQILEKHEKNETRYFYLLRLLRKYNIHCD